MKRAKFTNSGWRDLDRKLAKLASGVPEDRQRAALHAGGEVIAEEARRLAPYLTGLLQDSIAVMDKRDARIYGKVNLPAMSIYVGPVGSTDEGDVYYAKFQEFGTRFMQAQPFMRPAIATKRVAAERLMLTMLAGDVRSMAR